MMFRKTIICISFAFPWPVRRWLLKKLFGYQLHPTCKIGISWIFPKQLVMEAHSQIGNMNVCKGLDYLCLKEHSIIGRGNWISGFPTGDQLAFSHQADRIPQLILHEHSGISSRHILDCTNSITIGRFSTVGGYRSQFLTHSIDLKANRQSSEPIMIGDYCFIGTDCVLLGGSTLPDHSVLSAKSLLNKQMAECQTLYAGVPAKPVKKFTEEYLYFSRTAGFVH